MSTENIKSLLAEHDKTMALVADTLIPSIKVVADILVDALLDKKKILVMGNGGSAADAQHFVAELVGRFRNERRPLPAICLSGDAATLTAIGNDYGFNNVFSRQVSAFADQDDVVFVISTSGESVNICRAAARARWLGCKTVGLLGRGGGHARFLIDPPLIVPSDSTARIQEAHITIIHILCELIDQRILAAERQTDAAL